MPTATTITVLGLGPMGAAIAGALVEAGRTVRVWNRTPGRDHELVESGAIRADSVTDAVADSDLVISVLRDLQSTRALLEEVPADRLDRATVVALPSSTPIEAGAMAAWAAEHSLRWLAGAIMVPVPMIGTSDALILLAGSEAVLDEHRDSLSYVAGKLDYLGRDPGLPALFDTAMLEVFYAGLTAFLHGTAMATAHGIAPSRLLPYLSQMAGILPSSFEGMARDVDAGRYPGHDHSLAMELPTLEYIVRTGRDSGLDNRFPEAMRGLAAEAVARGHGDDGYSRLIELLRSPGSD